MSGPEEYTIADDTEVNAVKASLTPQEVQWLESADILKITSYQHNTGEITAARIDLEPLARIAFEYDLLQSVASRVEIDILKYFRQSSESTHTTSEIAEATGRPKSSISRALSNLVEKNKLTKVQAGVYRHSS
jgi:Fic family protein